MTLDQESSQPRPAPPAAVDDESAEPVRLAPSDLRRLHPLTPLFRSWRLVGVAGALGFGAFRDEADKLVWVWDALHGNADLGVVMRAFLLLVAAVAVSVFLAWLSWRTTSFAIVAEPGDAGTLLYHRGIINRQRSQVRLKRVQSVDVNQPFLPRLLGLAAVKLDMAAGEDASVNLSYLSRSDAWALREEILRHTSADGIVRDSSAASAPETVVGHVDTGQLVKATLVDGAWVWLLVVAWLVAVVVLGLTVGWKALAAALTGIIPVTVAILVQLRAQVMTILKDADFTVMRTPNGIRTRAGLTSTTNRTIDFDRVQAIRVERPTMWRWFGWARVRVDVAGADHAEGTSLMPVADDRTAVALAADVAGEPLEPRAGATGGGLAPAGARARRLDPLTWPWLGVGLLEHGAVTRTGWWIRTTTYVPYARVQSVNVQQGWLQRRLGLATVCLDLPSGATRWVGPHRGVADAARLVSRLSIAARQHRRTTASPPPERSESGAAQAT